MFDEIAGRMWDRNRLLSVLFELTYRCNLDCFYCYNDHGLKGGPISLERYIEVFRELRELDVMFLTLSGGEPLAHPKFFELGRSACQLGFAIKIKTNGHAVRDRILERIVEEIDPFGLDISLHGGKAATHDRQTRVPGSFDRLMQNLREIKDAGVRVQLNATMTSWNENEIEEMYSIADSFGFKLSVSPQVTPRDNGDTEPLSIAPSSDGVRNLMRVQRARDKPVTQAAAVSNKAGPAAQRSAPSKLCGTGSSTLAVDPVGNVYPCVQWRELLGNLHTHSIREIWSGSKVLDNVRSLNQKAAEMIRSVGAEGNICGFCQGLAALHGDPMKLYPIAEEQLALAKEQNNQK